jgi:hypothetical protein
MMHASDPGAARAVAVIAATAGPRTELGATDARAIADAYA